MRESFIKQAKKWSQPGSRDEMQMLLFALLATVTDDDPVVLRDCSQRIKNEPLASQDANQLWRHIQTLVSTIESPLPPSKIVNLTSHTIVICTEDGSFIELKPSGKIARIKQEFQRVGVVTNQGKDVEIFSSGQWSISDLPDPEPNTIYVVSGVTAYIIHEIFPDRHDVMRPGRQIRKGGSDSGAPVACVGLCRI